jgi:hypothetical protein
LVNVIDPSASRLKRLDESPVTFELIRSVPVAADSMTVPRSTYCEEGSDATPDTDDGNTVQSRPDDVKA